MPKTASHRLMPLLMIVPLALAGCAPADASTRPSASATDSADSDTAAETPSPLDPYLDVLYHRISDEAYLQQFLTVEETIAACMNEAGFDYTPRGEAYVTAEITAVTTQPSSREWVALNGYGINISQADAFAARDAADPNRGYVEGLSPAEQQAYYLALWGDENSGGDDSGCSGTVTGELPPSLSERWAPLVESLQQMWGQIIPADPEALAANEEWSGCMAAAGYANLATPQDAHTLVGEASTDGAVSADGDPEALQAEIAVALADLDCRENTDYDRRMRQVTVAAEAAFLDQNRSQLDAMLAESEQG